MRNLLIFIVLVALSGYLYSLFGQPLLSYLQERATEPETPLVVEAPPIVHAPIWTLEQVPTEGDVPQTRVSLSDTNANYPLGVFDGTCFLIEESAWELLPHEETGVICYWAGGGVEIGVFNNNGVRTVEQGIIEEPSAEFEGLRGEFLTIKAL